MNESPIALTIILNPNGSISVSGGCIHNLILSYGLLEGAKDVLREYNQQKQNKIVVPKDNRIKDILEK